MKEVIVLHKKEGETPLNVIENFKRNNPEYTNIPVTYAGRLDPMASGVLLLLAKEKIKEKEKYLALDKTYNFSVLFGFSTDTFDILGKICKTDFDVKNKYVSIKDFKKQIQNNLKYFNGKIKQEYPIYSSKTVNGKPLFYYARNNIKVKIPEKDIVIKKIKLEKVTRISGKKLFLNVEKRINKVEGDFRQKEIIRIWKHNLTAKNQKKLFNIAYFNIKCGSGTYVRQIAKNLGKKMQVPALALLIKRTKIGRFM